MRGKEPPYRTLDSQRLSIFRHAGKWHGASCVDDAPMAGAAEIPPCLADGARGF